MGLSKMFNNMLWICGPVPLDSDHTIRTNILDSWAVRMCMHSSSALNFVVVMQVERPGFEGRSSSHPADVSIALKFEALGSCCVVGVIPVCCCSQNYVKHLFVPTAPGFMLAALP